MKKQIHIKVLNNPEKCRNILNGSGMAYSATNNDEFFVEKKMIKILYENRISFEVKK